MLDIIEPSSSAVPLRLCVNYRKLNLVTKPDRYPVPNLVNSVYSLHGVRYFTSLDLVRGYYQLPLSPESLELTAFATSEGLYQFKRLPFGLRSAPACFQRAMQDVTKELPRDRVIVYIDDLLIMSSSFEEHLRLVSHVLSTLKSYGLKVKPEKCSWFKDEVDYLGHLVGVRKSPQFVAKVRDFPKPSTMGELRSFLGLANFQRKFVANFSSIQKPLSEKTTGRKSKLLHWSAEMNEAFETIKEKIAEDVCLSFPDYGPDSEPLQLFVDASGYGAGACLTQLQQNEQRIIAYSSTTFSKAERGYSTIERELAGLRWAC